MKIIKLIVFLSVLFLVTGKVSIAQQTHADTIKSNTLQPQVGTGGGGGGTGPTIVPPELDNSLIPPSPEAAALGKFGIFPVTYYTGMPAISIPITEIKTTKLDLPISLDYNYNGYRPSDPATWAGLGWTLNAGGVITRVVKGLPDDFVLNNASYHHWQDYSNINDLLLEPNGALMDGVGLHQIDPEPDIYSFHFNGNSGKFIVTGNRIYLFPRKDMSITGSPASGFIITTDDGTHYYFNDIETTNAFKSPSGSNYNTSWFLSKIVSSDGTDVINFNYTSYVYDMHSNFAESYTVTQGAQGCFDPSIAVVFSPTTPTVTAKQLVSITANNELINFIPQFDSAKLNNVNAVPSRLAEIDIYDSTSHVLLKKASLVHGYFDGSSSVDARNNQYGTIGHNHLKLSAVNIWGYFAGAGGVTDSLLQSYGLQYNNPTGSYPADTRGIDQWGYYNGKDSNQTLFPSSYFPVYSGCSYQYTPGDRNVYPQYTSNGLLTKMTFPTGGYTVFNFENNLIGGNPGPGMRIRNILSYDQVTPGAALTKTYKYNAGTRITPAYGYENYYTSYGTQTVNTITTNFSSPLASLIGNQFYYSSVTESSDSSGGNGSTNYQYFADETDALGVYLLKQVHYNAASQLVRSKTNAYTQGPSTTFTGFTYVLSQVLGNNNGTPYLQYSSLDTVQRQNIYASQGAYNLFSTCQYLTSTDDSTYDTNGQNSLNVHTSYYYDNPDYLRWSRSVTTNSKGQLQTIQVKYPPDYTLSSCLSAHGVDSIFQAATAGNSATYGSCIRVRDSTARAQLGNSDILNPTSGAITSTTALATLETPCEVNYYSASQSALTSLNNNQDAYSHCRFSAVGFPTSDANSAILLMQAARVLEPVEQIGSITRSGSEYLTMAVKTDYTQVGNSGNTRKILYQTAVPTGTQVLKSTFLNSPATYYQPRINFNYDAVHNNLVEEFKTGDVHTVYLWGYQSAFPLAKVEGSTYAAVSSLVNQNNLDLPGTDQQLQTYLNSSLRTNLSGAMVTTYTYYPLIGMTSATDPRGYTLSYEYDALGRLRDIKDMNGNIVKTFDYHYMGQP